jgi:hypothetical protein
MSEFKPTERYFHQGEHLLKIKTLTSVAFKFKSTGRHFHEWEDLIKHILNSFVMRLKLKEIPFYQNENCYKCSQQFSEKESLNQHKVDGRYFRR